MRRTTVPAVPRNAKEGIAEIDSSRVAGFIAWALAGNLRLDGDGGRHAAGPARRLPRPLPLQGPHGQIRPAARGAGIPFEIAGSDAFSENAEIKEVQNLLRALDDPDDPVATVAALRGLFFGLSDQDLIEHRAAGGRILLPRLRPGRRPARPG